MLDLCNLILKKHNIVFILLMDIIWLILFIKKNRNLSKILKY